MEVIISAVHLFTQVERTPVGVGWRCILCGPIFDISFEIPLKIGFNVLFDVGFDVVLLFSFNITLDTTAIAANRC